MKDTKYWGPADWLVATLFIGCFIGGCFVIIGWIWQAMEKALS